MIKKIRILQIIFTAATIIFLSCDKLPFDFRDKYLGKWNFNISLSGWNPSRGGDYTDSYICIGDFTTGVKFDELTLQSDYYSVTFRIDKYGSVISQFKFNRGGESGGFSGKNSFSYIYGYHAGAEPYWQGVDILGKR